MMHKTKQIIVIRKDLNMSIGKCCAQTAHAAMKTILDKTILIKIAEGSKLLADEWMWQLKINENEPIYNWLKGSFTKVVVGVDSLKELEDLEHTATKEGILVAKVLDEGRTEFHGRRTITALSIGPEWASKLDPITGHLKLL